MREKPLLASCAFHRVKTEALVWAMPSPWHTSPPWLPLSSLQACENVSSFCRTNSLFFCRELSQYTDIPTTTGICWERGGWPPGWGSWSWWIMFCTILGLCHYRGPHSKPLPKTSYPPPPHYEKSPKKRMPSCPGWCRKLVSSSKFNTYKPWCVRPKQTG